jgi:TetR/AcrR family transcriptional regulator, transcriptional repressor for nem operon
MVFYYYFAYQTFSKMPLTKTTPKEIIKTSIAVFLKQGYYRTTMNDLAKATGLTKGAFYHHFQNKEDVMKKSLEALMQWFHKNIFILAEDKAIPHKQRLAHLSEVLYKAFTENTGGCFFANTIMETAHVEDTFIHEIHTFFNHWEKALTHIFSIKYKGKALKQLVQQTIADIEGSIILLQLKKDPLLLKHALQRAVDRI